ncbi:DUF748 domain-containing protein [Pleomorphovibrio marinus]|uniref:DUF748 domain-containing protein n=1 Tax=Pleomorphovibrio marinus TaxID=2164132 RepID=UPI000E0A3A4E|nr:DUF748 domain-containing protein [Pleomorphovibrio marinus]
MKNKKTLIIIGSIFLFFLLILTFTPTLVNWYLNRNAEKIVSDMITRTDHMAGHEVHFGNIRFDYNFRGTFLRLEDVDIQPGEALEDRDKIKFYLNMKSASLTGFQWVDFLFFNSIKLDSANLEDAVLETHSPPLDSLDLDNGDLEENGQNYNRIGVNHIRVNKVSFENRDTYNDSTRLFIQDLFVYGDDFLLTDEDLADPNAVFEIRKIEGYMDQAVVHFNTYRNAILAKDMSFNTDDKKLSIEKVILDNKMEKYEYIRQFDYETDWIELNQGKVEIEGMDFQAYIRERNLIGETLSLSGLELEVFRDKRKPEDTERRPDMIHEIIKGLSKKVRIKEIQIEDAYIAYEERPDNDAPKAGRIYFDQVSGTIGPFSNFSEDLEEDDKMEVKAKGRLIGKGLINLHLTYFINDESGKFLMRGDIGGMDITPLNQMIEPATQVALKSGNLLSVDFNIEANDIEGRGDLIVKYADLEIEILDKDFGRNQGLFRRIGSFLANKIVVRNQNPNPRGSLSEGTVYFKREQHKFIFSYWWDLVLSGLRTTITGESEEDLRESS